MQIFKGENDVNMPLSRKVNKFNNVIVYAVISKMQEMIFLAVLQNEETIFRFHQVINSIYRVKICVWFIILYVTQKKLVYFLKANRRAVHPLLEIELSNSSLLMDETNFSPQGIDY